MNLPDESIYLCLYEEIILKYLQVLHKMQMFFVPRSHVLQWRDDKSL